MERCPPEDFLILFALKNTNQQKGGGVKTSVKISSDISVVIELSKNTHKNITLS